MRTNGKSSERCCGLICCAHLEKFTLQFDKIDRSEVQLASKPGFVVPDFVLIDQLNTVLPACPAYLPAGGLPPEQLTVVQLKVYLRKKGLRLTGLKAALVSRVQQDLAASKGGKSHHDCRQTGNGTSQTSSGTGQSSTGTNCSPQAAAVAPLQVQGMTIIKPKYHLCLYTSMCVYIMPVQRSRTVGN